MSSDPWQPSANLHSLQARAQLNHKLRDFFHQRNIMEVETPLLASCGVSDPFIECFQIPSARDYFLQSSPEYAMKRLLASGCGDIYSLAKVFRAGENGRRHNSEFTMLEWYRLGLDERQLMAEVAELIKSLQPDVAVHSYSYQQVFEQWLGVNPHRATLAELQQLVDQNIDMGSYRCEDESTALDLLFSHVIEPALDAGLVFVYDYPSCQAALAKVMADESGQFIARRFEAFFNNMELANGYWELVDAQEQAHRFEQDINMRRLLGLPPVPLDKNLLAAMEQGLPDCAGVAMGVDRLLMQLMEESDIRNVLSFDFSRA